MVCNLVYLLRERVIAVGAPLAYVQVGKTYDDNPTAAHVLRHSHARDHDRGRRERACEVEHRRAQLAPPLRVLLGAAPCRALDAGQDLSLLDSERVNEQVFGVALA